VTQLGLCSLGALALVLGAMAAFTARAGIKEGGPDPLAATRSLNSIIQQAGERPTHIIFVHGMSAEGPGTSQAFRERLCHSLAGGCRPAGNRAQPVRSERFALGDFPRDARIMGFQIWKAEDEWRASRPFVDRYVFNRSKGGPIVVDEVNWWPLIHPLKCRGLVQSEVNLSGADDRRLQLCACADDPHFAWLDPDTVKKLIAARPKSGGGALINAAIKREIMDWGLADAVMAVGPLRVYVRRAMQAAFEYAATFDHHSVDDQDFVVISESLGSFATMDAYAASNAASHAVRDVLERTYDLYFFANQFAMLELARIEGLPAAVAVESFDGAATPAPSPLRSLQDWSTAGLQTQGIVGTERPARIKQIIAFNDPSDLLTFDVPAISGAKVVNLYDRNAWRFLGLFESPTAAHTGHSRNPAVLKTMFGQ
jgi:hypothetical protein